MDKETRVFNLNLPAHLAEDFYRMFPERGMRSQVLRNVIAKLVSLEKVDKETSGKIVRYLKGEE